MYPAAEAYNNNLVRLVKEEDYNHYFEGAQTGIVYLDEKLRVNNLNREAERICGVARVKVLGKSADTAFQHLGDKFLRVLNISEYDDICSTNLKVRVKDQLSYIHIDALKVRHTNGNSGVILIMQDVSAVRAAIKQIQTTQMLMSLGELAAGVAHHVRTPLTTISGYLQVMMNRLEDDKYTVRRDVLELLFDEVAYINNVVKELVLFAKPQVNKQPDINVNRVIEEALLLTFKQMGGEHIAIDKQLAQGLPEIHADSNLLKQALVNILQNALEAMHDEGNLTVKSWLNSDVNMLVIAITDTGDGVTPEIMPRVFEPFYTTKLDRMGLGLPIAYRIITEHGGFINIGPNEGQGTKVHVYLPIYDGRLRRLTVVHQQILNLQ
jgi:two-component system sensor histidine kinase AtoS